MKALKRRYVYQETFNKVMDWALKNDIRSPNKKLNFPFYLEKYLEARR